MLNQENLAIIVYRKVLSVHKISIFVVSMSQNHKFSDSVKVNCAHMFGFLFSDGPARPVLYVC